MLWRRHGHDYILLPTGYACPTVLFIDQREESIAGDTLSFYFAWKQKG
jgi:hypothetical protein